MERKKGFTLIELIAVISVLAILLVILIPNIMNLVSNSNTTLRDSKIRTLETVGEKYGNSSINQYQNCIYGATSQELKDDCSLSVNSLVSLGYIDADNDDGDIIDPETKEPLKGNILFCYNPVDIRISAKYVEDVEEYSCSAVDIKTGASLNLSATSGTGYVGGDPVDVTIIRDGNFDEFSCESEDEDLATCTIEKSTMMRITVTASEMDEASKEVKITLRGKTTSGTYLEQVFTLVIKKSSLSLDGSSLDNECIPKNGTQQFAIVSENSGDLTLESSDEDILYGDINKNILIVQGGRKEGEATLSLKESNGNAEINLKRRVFTLETESDLPEGLLLGNEEKVKVIYGGNDSVTIKTDTPEIVHFYSDKESESTSITLDGEEEFTIKVVGIGEGNIEIVGNPCGSIKKTLKVSNLYVRKHTAELFVGGASFDTQIVANQNDTFSCESKNENIATCKVSGVNLEIIPGNTQGTTEVNVYGTSGGMDTVKVTVTKTSIGVYDANGRTLSHVCESTDSSEKSSEVFIRGQNFADLVVDKVSDEYLAQVEIVGNEVILHKKYLDASTAFDNYIVGHNTGIVNVDIKEQNGNAHALFDYYIYNIEVPNSPYEVIAGTTSTIDISSYASGILSVSSSDPEIASVMIENPDYSYNLNARNVSKIFINAKRTGETSITLKGADCGEKTFILRVVGQTYSIKTLHGTYTEVIGEYDEEDLSCTTTGDNDSCEVIFPEIKTLSEFRPVGYSRIKDSTVAEYLEGDTLVLNKDNDGTVYYGNSTDITKPVCIIKEQVNNLLTNRVETLDVICTEAGSGIAKRPTIDDFVLSDPTIATIESIDDPVENFDSDGDKIGETFRLNIRNNKNGSYTLSLKEGAIIDNCDNVNDEVELGLILATDFKAKTLWNIGKENFYDVVAILYDNDELYGTNSEKKTYTLAIFGNGEMLSFDSENGYIPPWQLDYQNSIVAVEVNEGVKNIGSDAFYTMYNLESVTVGEGVEVIEKKAFMYTSLNSVTLPTTLKKIDFGAFYKVNNLETVVLNEGLEVIGENAFSSHSLSEIFIPKTVKTIGANAFTSDIDNMNLNKITFEEGSQLEFIMDEAFRNHIVEELVIPASVRSIGVQAFARTRYIDEYPIKKFEFETGSNLEVIASQAFMNSAISCNVELPDSLVSIEEGAFLGLGEGAYYMLLGEKLESIASPFVMGPSLRAFGVSANNQYFSASEGVLYSKDKLVLIKYPDNYYALNPRFNLPSSVYEIGPYAFSAMPKADPTAKNIIDLSTYVRELNLDTNFIDLITSEINVDNGFYKSVDGVIYDSTLKTAYRLPTNYNSEAYSILEGVETVDDFFAYDNVTVKNLTIPASVNSIGAYAFSSDPTYGLTNIYLNSSNALSLGYNAFAPSYYGDRSVPVTINVRNEDLKTRLEQDYASMSDYMRIKLSESTIDDKIKASSKGTISYFDRAAVTDEGIYEMQDESGTSYYFRGAVENNYVEFAGYYWRIIRVNGDGSFRIMYDGTRAYANGEYSEDRIAGYSVWGTSNDYGSSVIKTALETWYNNNIPYDYRKYIQDTYFINEIDTSGLFNRQETLEVSGTKPELKYSSLTYVYSVSDGNMNFPVGLITADEAVLAGSGTPGKNNGNYYLYKGNDYWTMTVDTENLHGGVYYYGIGSQYDILYSEDNEDAAEPYSLAGYATSKELGFAPVINLTLECVRAMEGNGTMTDPYRLKNNE